MTGQAGANIQFNPYLSPSQQSLLLAAFSSNQPTQPNKHKNTPSQPGHPPAIKRSSSDKQRHPHSGTASSMPSFTTPLHQTPTSEIVDGFGLDDSPFLDYVDGDTGFEFDFDNSGLGQDMIGAFPDDTLHDDGEAGTHDKRKSLDDDDDDDDDGEKGAKRREGEDKTAKKPGRKPLTSEPTTKRKAQNRAAQRAFRERKERHLKDLETKVSELTKVSEADKHENGLLRAQVERLSMELSEYRKRMSGSNSGVSRSPPSSANVFGSKLNGGQLSNDFQFEFPTFGILPSSQVLGPQASLNGSYAKPQATQSPSHREQNTTSPVSSAPPQAPGREDNSGRSSSVKSQTNGNGSTGQSPITYSYDGASRNSSTSSTDGPQSTVPYMPTGSGDMFANLFGPPVPSSVIQDAGSHNYSSVATPQTTDPGTDTTSGLNRVFHFNSNSASSNTDSPSTSSASQYNANSSCGTSPEPSQSSPYNGTIKNKPFGGINEGSSFTTYPTADINGIDWLAAQNGGRFDPVLFGDYRESQDAIVGDGDFTGGFFNEAYPFDLGSPLNFGDLMTIGNSVSPTAKSPASQSLLGQGGKQRQGQDDGAVVPKKEQEDDGNMLSCNSIWYVISLAAADAYHAHTYTTHLRNRIQNNAKLQDGNFDLDGLCSELKAKARCSETGLVIDKRDVDAAIARKNGQGAFTVPSRS
ncbi:DNA-binding transcription factor yap1 [Elasticomyces elasticus]|nr:DNA-binding transcription factor yap1 [Elasticomyces elasticus]